MKSLDSLLEERITSSDIADAQQYYIDNTEQFETADESAYSEYVLERLAASFVSPIQSIQTPEATYFGVSSYQSGDEWFGYVAYDDRSDGARRVVGTREIPDANREADIPHVTAGDPTGSFADDADASFDALVARLSDHYDDKYGSDRDPAQHNGPPDRIVGQH